MSIVDKNLKDTAYACVAIKTTGLTHGYDRVCEVAAALAEPGQPVRLVLDSVVNPQRKLAGAEIHGIHDFSITSFVPTFDEVALDLMRAIQGRVLVGHNLHYTLSFLKDEYEALGIDITTPYLDTMSLTSMLTKKPNRPLLEACDQLGIEPRLEPTAAAAALDTARLLRKLLQKVSGMRLTSFKHLQGKRTRPFQSSLDLDLLPTGMTYNLEESVARVSRHERGVEGVPNVALALYWDALLVALDDLVITDAELRHLTKLKSELQLSVDDVAMLHARVFSGSLVGMIHGETCSAAERGKLAGLWQCLERLGWAPGSQSEDTIDETED